MPSILSNTPPWPGSKSLVSLTLALRFKSEINRSPNCEIKDIRIVIISMATRRNEKIKKRMILKQLLIEHKI